MKQAPCMTAMYIDLQHRHNHYNKHKEIATRMAESVVYGGWVKNNDIPDKDDYLNFK